MTKLSVNINKVATIRNARGGNMPNVIQVAQDCERFGAQGITVHPRPDERHIRYADVRELKKVVKTELNVEGYPSKEFIDLVLEVKPHQVTLVPDLPEAITSDSGWDTVKHNSFLKEIITEFKNEGIRTSLFIDPSAVYIYNAMLAGTDRIEYYTEPYVKMFAKNREMAIVPFTEATKVALQCGVGINAGHDLNLENLNFFYRKIAGLLEVSIGHALISDALYYGLENTIQMYLKQLKNS